MRISDWSSDVCSSDLQIALRVRRLLRSQMVGFDASRHHALGEGRGECMAEHGHPSCLAGDDFPSRMFRQPDDGRSEEHTSELQSLMRISYAVFCLKKKKQPTRPLTHTTSTPYANIHPTRQATTHA